jgi:D-amino-acid oxidase
VQALVLGGGVVGLSTAIRLQEAGWRVALWSADPPERTTSAVAAAIWYPYRAYPERAVAAGGAVAFAELARGARDEPESGVRMRAGVELWRHAVPEPWWAAAVPSLRRLAPAELPAGYADGHEFTVPVADMTAYLPYLAGRLARGGARVERRAARSLGEALAECPVVENCTGLGARSLVGDATVAPVRGQVVRVANPGLTRFVLDDDHPDGLTYVVPRDTDCILGGTAEPDRWETTPDAATADAILRRCAALEPRLAAARVLEHRVGLRPARPAVRLEAERHGDGLVVHNYGHGGAGVTLAWGCAAEVVERVGAGGSSVERAAWRGERAE